MSLLSLGFDLFGRMVQSDWAWWSRTAREIRMTGVLRGMSIYCWGYIFFTALYSSKLWTATPSKWHHSTGLMPSRVGPWTGTSRLQRRQIGKRLAGPGSLDGNGGKQKQGSSARQGTCAKQSPAR